MGEGRGREGRGWKEGSARRGQRFWLLRRGVCWCGDVDKSGQGGRCGLATVDSGRGQRWTNMTRIRRSATGTSVAASERPLATATTRAGPPGSDWPMAHGPPVPAMHRRRGVSASAYMHAYAVRGAYGACGAYGERVSGPGGAPAQDLCCVLRGLLGTGAHGHVDMARCEAQSWPQAYRASQERVLK